MNTKLFKLRKYKSYEEVCFVLLFSPYLLYFKSCNFKQKQNPQSVLGFKDFSRHIGPRNQTKRSKPTKLESQKKYDSDTVKCEFEIIQVPQT